MTARASLPVERRRDRLLSAFGLAVLRHQRGDRTHAGLRPLFIVGSGRSGNTLARRVLMATGGIYIPPETFVLGDIVMGWPRTTLLTWRERVWLFCAHFEKHSEFATFGLANLDEFAREVIALPEERRSLRSLVDSFYRYLARSQGAQALRWGDKTPFNTFHLPAFEAAFPDAQYLWLVRDGRDACLSYVETGLFSALDDAASRWVSANRACAGLAARRGDVFRQSYENLVRAPEESFAGICDWAGLDFAPAMLSADIGPMGDVETLAHHDNVARPISASSVGRWRTRLSPDDLSRLPSAFWDMMETLGYDREGA